MKTPHFSMEADARWCFPRCTEWNSKKVASLDIIDDISGFSANGRSIPRCRQSNAAIFLQTRRSSQRLDCGGWSLGAKDAPRLDSKKMISAARALPTLSTPSSNHGWRVAFLSGARYWYQSLFCFTSLQLQVPIQITPVFYDDGTFTDESRGFISRVVPWATFESIQSIDERLDLKDYCPPHYSLLLRTPPQVSIPTSVS